MESGPDIPVSLGLSKILLFSPRSISKVWPRAEFCAYRVPIIEFAMPPFISTASKAVRSVTSLANGAGHLIRPVKGSAQVHKLDHIRCFNGIVPPVRCADDDLKFWSRRLLDSNYTVQTRRFLGCGDGDEGGVLSKIYEEKRVMGYSPEQLFDVVAAVDLYHGFVPWCQRSEIIKQYPDGSFDAELEIGFKFLVESYISHVELSRPKSIKTTAKDSTLFDHLINVWEFNPGPVPGTCDLHFLVDFKFQSPLYRQVASMFFKEVVSRLVGSFSDRCRLIYGPGVPMLEKSLGQRA